jgi:hypothetical protein
MATRKKVTQIVEENPSVIVSEMIKVTKEDFSLIGKDAELTDMIYGKPLKVQVFKSDILPEATGEIGGVTDNLQLFINTYQPGELISRRTFRELLLQCLNDWKAND